MANATVSVILTSVWVVVQYNITIGSDRLWMQVIRLVLTITLCVAVYDGFVVAKKIFSVLMLLGLLGYIGLFFATINSIHWTFSLSIFANAFTYVYYLFAVWVSPDVATFLEIRRTRHTRQA